MKNSTAAAVLAITLASCATAPPTAPGAGIGHTHTSAIDMQGVDTARHDIELADYRKYSSAVNVVMIGDSITFGGDWNELFPHVKIANKGINGDRTEDILKRMETIFSVQPKKAFLMVGINDLYHGKSIASVFENYINIVTQLRSKNITVFIQSTLECSKSKCGEVLDKVRELNAKLKDYASRNSIAFININDELTTEKDGLLSEYTPDGIHLLGSGYLKWRKKISANINSN